jgi:hypothetical protein
MRIRIPNTEYPSKGESSTHKVHIYLEYHTVCPLVGLGTSPPPFRKRVRPPRNRRGEGASRLRLRRGCGGVPKPTTGEKAKLSANSVLVFFLLCACTCIIELLLKVSLLVWDWLESAQVAPHVTLYPVLFNRLI